MVKRLYSVVALSVTLVCVGCKNHSEDNKILSAYLAAGGTPLDAGREAGNWDSGVPEVFFRAHPELTSRFVTIVPRGGLCFVYKHGDTPDVAFQVNAICNAADFVGVQSGVLKTGFNPMDGDVATPESLDKTVRAAIARSHHK